MLTEGLHQGNEQAFRWLYTHYAVTLQLHILKLVHDREQANDLVQDVFIKIWQNLHKYDARKGRLYTWMRNIAHNTAIDAIRAGKAKSKPISHHLLPIDETTSHLIDRQHYTPATTGNHIGLEVVVGRLRPQHQQLIDLVYLKGYSQQETADALALPIGTVKTRLRVALRLLKQLL